jgi:hypothetical protein
MRTQIVWQEQPVREQLLPSLHRFAEGRWRLR